MLNNPVETVPPPAEISALPLRENLSGVTVRAKAMGIGSRTGIERILAAPPLEQRLFFSEYLPTWKERTWTKCVTYVLTQPPIKNSPKLKN